MERDNILPTTAARLLAQADGIGMSFQPIAHQTRSAVSSATSVPAAPNRNADAAAASAGASFNAVADHRRRADF
jgi:hypothetical protein